MSDIPWNDRPAMQENCIHCGKPQFKGIIRKVSEGKDKCVWCGKPGEPMTNEAYLQRIKQFNVNKGKSSPRDYH